MVKRQTVPNPAQGQFGGQGGVGRRRPTIGDQATQPILGKSALFPTPAEGLDGNISGTRSVQSASLSAITAQGYGSITFLQLVAYTLRPAREQVDSGASSTRGGALVEEFSFTP